MNLECLTLNLKGKPYIVHSFDVEGYAIDNDFNDIQTVFYKIRVNFEDSDGNVKSYQFLRRQTEFLLFFGDMLSSVTDTDIKILYEYMPDEIKLRGE